ncbi:MAG: amidohydrolase family protein [Pseudomonadota bacterium]
MNVPNRIVDAHHHLWDLSHCTYPWLMEKGVKRFFGDPAPIQKNYLVDDFRADFGNLPIEKSVHIQVGVTPDDSVKETAWLQAQGDADGLPSAIVAFADLTAPDLTSQLDAQSRYERLRGIRQIVGRSAEEDRKTGTQGLLSSSEFISGLQTLAHRGLSFDLQLTPPLMNAAADVFEQVPDLRVALCHAGSPSDFSLEALSEWRGGLERLASLPNLICKVSGFGMFQPDWTTASIRPLVISAIEIFGPDRIAFGSNFPVDRLASEYVRVMGAYLEITADFTPTERTAMFAGVAERFYRL